MDIDIIGKINQQRSNPKYMEQLLDFTLSLKEQLKLEDKMILIIKHYIEKFDKLEPLPKLENNNILSHIIESKLSDFFMEGSEIDEIVKQSLPKEFKNPQLIVIKSKEKISNIGAMLLNDLNKFKNRVEILFNPKLNQIGIAIENAKKDGEENKLILLFANKDDNESNSILNNEIKEEEENSSNNEIKNEIRVNVHAPGEHVKKNGQLNNSTNSRIGQKGFNKIFELEKELQEQIKNFKSKKTMIFIEFSSRNEKTNEKIYDTFKFISSNREDSIEIGKKISFEYINDQEKYRSEIKEKIALVKDNKIIQNFIIIVKRNHDNYYKIFVDIEEEEKKNYSLEIVCYEDDSRDIFDSINVYNKAIKCQEKFPKTKRYNIINIDFEESFKLYNTYAKDTIDIKKSKDIFKEKNLCYTFLYNNNKKIGEIFEIKEDKKIEELKDNEKIILVQLNMLIKDHLGKSDFVEKFKEFYNRYNYKMKSNDCQQEDRNTLEDLNEKFISINFSLKYYDNSPTISDFNDVKACCFLNIYIKNNKSDDFANLIKEFISKTERIFNEYSKYLQLKDKILILLNYLIVINNSKEDTTNYTFKIFNELKEESTYIQSELLYRKIISKLTENSNLFFLYLKLNSGADVDLVSGKYLYKVKHISLIELKTHLLMDFFYPYFFVYEGSADTWAWNSNSAQIKNYNLSKSKNKFVLDEQFIMKDAVKLTILKLHEYSHTKYKGNNSLQISPRYFYNKNLDSIDNIKITDHEIISGDIKINDYLGESGVAIEKYLFGDNRIADLILNSNDKDLSCLFDADLYVKSNFKDLQEKIKQLDLKFDEKQAFSRDKQQRKGRIQIPKLKIRNIEKRKPMVIYYYDLGINSIDYEGNLI